MKKSVKIIAVLLMVVLAVSVVTVPCFATTAKSVIDKITPETPSGNEKILSTAGKIMGYIKWIAAVAAVIIVGILGIKYMLGSVEEKAEYKKSFVPLIVGAAVVVLATQIAGLIFQAFE